MNARNRFRLVIASALSVGILLPLATTAYASGSLTVKTIGTKTAPYKKSVAVSPSYKRTGNVDVSSALLTVKKGKKTVKKNTKKINLKAGKYKVTQKVKYRTWSNVATKKTVVTAGQLLFGEFSTNYGSPFVEECRFTSVADPSFTMRCKAAKWTESKLVSLGNFDVSGTYLMSNGQTVTFVIDGTSIVSYSGQPSIGTTFDLYAADVSGIKATANLSESVTTRKYSAHKTKTKTHNLTIKQGKKPGRTNPISSWNCPNWAPIKGNASSMIYHMKHQRFYKKTKPEDCFSSEKAAKKAGYRKAKV